MYVQSCTLCFIALVTNSLYQWSLWQICVYDAYSGMKRLSCYCWNQYSI